MEDRSRMAEVKVGLFVVGALLALVVGSLWVAGSSLVGARRVPYRVSMTDSAGVETGDRVRFAGVPVGRVRRVELQPEEGWPVVLHVSLHPDIPVKADSVARISTSGLLGASFLQIEPGSPGAPRLPPGGEIRGQAGLGLEEALARVNELSEKVLGIMDQTSLILEQVGSEVGPIMSRVEALLSDENVKDVRHILAALHETVENSGPRITALLERLESISDSLDEGLEKVPELTARVSALADDIRTAFGPDGSRLAGVLEAAEGGLTSADAALSVVTRNREEIELAIRDLRDTVANLKAFSQQVKERPFSLVRIKGPPDRRPGHGVAGRNP